MNMQKRRLLAQLTRRYMSNTAGRCISSWFLTSSAARRHWSRAVAPSASATLTSCYRFRFSAISAQKRLSVAGSWIDRIPRSFGFLDWQPSKKLGSTGQPWRLLKRTGSDYSVIHLCKTRCMRCAPGSIPRWG